MTHVISDKSAKVLVVEPQAARRSMLVDGIKKLGFSKVNSVPTLKDAYGVIEGDSETVDWIITPPLEDQGVNAFHLLVMILETESLRGCRVTLVVDDGQDYLLTKAYSLGLYSHHSKMPDKTSQMATLSDIFARGEEQGWNDCLIAAHYLREHLKEKNRFDDVERLEVRLLSLFPNHPTLSVNLAEALFLGLKLDAAQRVLSHLPPLTGETEQAAAVLSERLQSALSAVASGDRSGFAMALSIGRCLLVDPDEAARKAVKAALSELYVETIDEAADGEEAWRLMQTDPPPDLVIQEWRIPKLAGDMLVQRTRARGLADAVVVVYSSLVKTEDRLLLREMGVTDVIMKPRSGPQLAASLISILKEERRPKTIQGLERQIRAALAKHDLGTAQRLLGELASAAGKEATQLHTALEAEIAFHTGDLQRASDLATKALHVGGEDVMVLNLLGKIQMKLRRFDAATSYFDQAQRLSPQNVARLAALAESQAVSDQTAKAEASLARAQTLDSGNPQVVEAEAKVALAKGDAQGAKAAIEKGENATGIVAFVNNRAVALVGRGKVKESVDLYKTALAALPPGQIKARPLVNYNLALALARLGDLRGAKKAADAATGFKADEALEAKIQSLSKRLTKAVETGEKLVLNLKPEAMATGGEAEAGAEDEAARAVRASVEAGTARLHQVFEDESADPRVVKLLQSGGHYKGRKALQKGGHAGKGSKAS